MIGDYPAHHQIQDLKNENAALHGLLEKQAGRVMGDDVVESMIKVMQLMTSPQVHIFGFGSVSVGNGILNEGDGSVIVLLRNEEDIRAVGAELKVEPDRRMPTDKDTLLVFWSTAGLDVLIQRLQVARTKLVEVTQ